tara:strand:+ start:181 stop:729 length:549 start_codon:yes stop_codon:yes gene_type:complete
MRILLFFVILLLLSNCTTIEVAKEVSKASKSIKNSVQKVIKNDDQSNNDNSVKNEKEKLVTQDENISLEEKVDLFKKEKETVELEKEKVGKLVEKQKEVVKIDFVGKTINEIYMRLGDSNLFRLDGNTQTMRYDNDACRLFLFFNSSIPIPRVEYFEIRNPNGKLINEKSNIEKCYKNFNLS